MAPKNSPFSACKREALRLVCVLFVVAHQGLSAATFQVGIQRQYASIEEVLPMLGPGDVVEVDGGWNYPGGFSLDNSGSEKAKITIRGIRVNGQRPRIVGVNGKKGGALVALRGNHCVLEGFDISAAGDALVGRGLYVVADDVLVRDCVVHDSAVTGIASSDRSGSLRLEDVEVHHCGKGDREHQIYIGTDNAVYPKAVFHMEFCYVHDGIGGNNVKSRASRTELHYNWIESAFYHELDLIGADPKGQAQGTEGAVREDAEVVGNVLVHPEYGKGNIARLGTDNTGQSNGRYRFVGNTVVLSVGQKPGKEIFRTHGGIESIEVSNNVFIAAGRFLSVGLPPVHTAGQNNWFSTGSRGIPVEWTKTLYGSDPLIGTQGSQLFVPLKGSPLKGAASYPSKPVPGFEFPKPLERPGFLPPQRDSFSRASAHRPRPSAADLGALESQP